MPALAAMAGSSIAGRDAAPWVTDFLNAACFRRSDRNVDDLRLAFCVLTTYWWRRAGGRLRLTDLPAFHRAFGRVRIGRGGSETGRFTPLRPGGLDGQTFEIEVAAATGTPLPLFTRGYVTVTHVGARAPWAGWVGADSAVVGGVELTTHAGHFLGAGISRLVVYEHDDRAWIRDVGTWDPLPASLTVSYRLTGREAQRAFWGTDARRSMLVQLARRIA
ncbi:MAG: hypothetical protein WKF94_16955 [Solirubrobacteraceae bacterium]